MVAIGGGGLIAGMATAARAIKPGIEIIGVQASRFPAMFNAIKGTHLPQGNSSIAEGIAVGTPGVLPQAIIRDKVNDLVLVDEGDIEQAIVMLLEVEKTLVEGAGAAGLAALLKYPERFQGKKVGVVLCGGNIDPLLLAAIIERGMVRAGRLARLKVSARDVPGTLALITATVANAGRQYQRGAPPAGLHHAGGAKRGDRVGDPDPRPAAHHRGAGRRCSRSVCRRNWCYAMAPGQAPGRCVCGDGVS